MALSAVGLVIGRIVSALENEASLIGGVRDELNQLKLEFASMRSFLEDTDKTTVQTEGEKTWVANVRDLAYEVEDIIDEYMYYMNKQKVYGKFTRFLRQIVYAPKNLWVRHRIATKLQKINSMIKAIPERNRRYGVDRVGEASSCSQDHQRQPPNLSESSLFFKDDDLVGIEDGKKQLLDWLVDKEESQRTVISVVGMGGSGKTTLVAQAYNSQIVKRQFDCYAWITVSQTYLVDDLLQSMIKEFYRGAKEAIPMDLSSMSYRELIEMITNFLRLKRYVIVFDDVWSSNLWRDIHVSLLDEGLGSRVILTTRNEEIASSSFGVKSYVHYIKLLCVSDAWNLFCMKAFSSNPNRCCPQHLKTLAQDLVAKCKGLPLAIVALGGVMSSKYLESEWRNIYNSLSWELSNNPGLEVVKTILLLSYNDLPYRLKCCFLYCCLFPEDYEIKRKRLIRLWMAEGFVEKVRGRTPEEVAESYLMELICRSMLQVVMRNQFGRPRRCKMHDLMRELAISTSETEKFCVAYDGREANDEESATNRRMSIQSIDRELQSWNWKGMLKLRSLLVFVVEEIALPLGLRLLRVLDLENAPIEVLPEELVDLFNLRYLNLKGTRVKELPKSVGRLCNLNTLDITNSKIEVLPAGITELQNLRHLMMYRRDYGILGDFHLDRGTTTPSNICKLKNLQVLAGVEAQADLMKRIKNMTQLKRIGITKVREVDEEDLCTAIQNMSLLRHLSVRVIDEDEYLRMDALSSTPPLYLKVLVLAGKLEKVPCWFHSLQNLTFLSLRWSRLTEDPIPYIQALPNLGWLELCNAYEGGGQLSFSEGFHKLRKLSLWNFPQLNEIIIERGVMPGLQAFYIRKCMQLKILPHGIEYLEDLQELDLMLVTNELIECIRGEGSKDHQKVSSLLQSIYEELNMVTSSLD
ncbi:hypothetical protein ACSBR1_018549 [Camellia fascicularis]